MVVNYRQDLYMPLASCVTYERILFVSYTYTLYKVNIVEIFEIIKFIRVVSRPYFVLVTLNTEVYPVSWLKNYVKLLSNFDALFA